MGLRKLYILLFGLLVIGASAEAGSYTGLKSDTIYEVKPKTCDFKWWKGSKNYDSTTTDNTTEKTDQSTKN